MGFLAGVFVRVRAAVVEDVVFFLVVVVFLDLVVTAIGST